MAIRKVSYSLKMPTVAVSLSEKKIGFQEINFNET